MKKTETTQTGKEQLPAKIIQDLQLAENEDQMRQAAQLLINSGAIHKDINTPEKVFMLTKYGKELGIGEAAALNGLILIRGRITMSYQIMGGLLKKRNYEWEIIKDFEKELNADGSDKVGSDGQPNFVTEIKFTWIPQKFIDIAEKHNRSDLIQKMTHIERRTWREFLKAGFITEKNVWNTLPKLMMRIRTFAFGARFVAPEALANMYESSEIADTKGMNYTIDKAGNIKIINNETMVDAEIIQDK